MVPLLLTGRLCHGDQLRLSQLLGVSTRTLRNWRAQGASSGPARRDLGRPSSPRKPWSVLRWTVKTWRGLVGGHDGWRTLLLEAQRADLALSTRWLQQIVAELKRRDAARARSRVEHNRQHVVVHAKNAIWADDELFLGRDEEGQMRGRVVRDGLCPEVLVFGVGPPAEAEDMVAYWEVVRAARGCLPFVISLDNGAAGRSLLVRRYLAEHQVIALYNEPHVPQHNALVEREIGDLRRAVDAGRELWGALSGLAREQRTLPPHGFSGHPVATRSHGLRRCLDDREEEAAARDRISAGRPEADRRRSGARAGSVLVASEDGSRAAGPARRGPRLALS